MTGQDQDGGAADYHRREHKRPVPSGPLTKTQIVDIQTTIARGLAGIGYTDQQIAQVLNRSERTATRRSEGARPHVPAPTYGRHVTPYV